MDCTCSKHGEFEKFTLNISEETWHEEKP